MSVSPILTGFLILFPALTSAEFDAAQLQSLFMTVEQRHEVDDIRNGVEKEVFIEPLVSEKKSEKINLNGFMKRSDGKNVVWVNGKNTMQGDSLSDMKVQTRGINSSNEVPVMIEGKRQLLKPGETWLRPSNLDSSSVSP